MKTFIADPTLPIMQDKQLGLPVLVLGYYHDETGKPIEAEVVRTRVVSPVYLAPYAITRSTTPDAAARDLMQRLDIAARQLAGHINAGAFDALPEELVGELRDLSAFLLEASENVAELLLDSAPQNAQARVPVTTTANGASFRRS